MSDCEPNDPILQEALSHYFFADNASGMAQAIRELGALVHAASAATRKLLGAIEEWSSRIVDLSSLRIRHAELLRAHQVTWAAAFMLELPGRHDSQVLSMLHAVWKNLFFNIILDRMNDFSTEVQFGNITYSRFFGECSSTIKDGTLFVTDQNLAFDFVVNNNYMESIIATNAKCGVKLPVPIQLDFAVRIMDAQLQTMGCYFEGRPISISESPRNLINYGPVGSNDSIIKVESLRGFAAALDFIKARMDTAAEFFVSHISDKRPVWDFMLKHKVSPTAFARAANQFRRIDRHAIETNLSRHRKRTAGPEAKPSASKSRPKKKVIKRPKTAQISRKASKKPASARRGKLTP